MRRCLAVLGDVPEFKDGLARVEALEARLKAMLEPKLLEVLAPRCSLPAARVPLPGSE